MSERPSRVAGGALLAVVLVTAALLAVQLHRTGHTQGDDFALYLRQARSLFDGDIGAVVADNRFSVLNSDGAFSPIAYPWGWPLLLAPFVRLWGLDYDALKLVEVATFCVWLGLLHGIVRRRIGRIPALAVVAVIGTAPVYLAHTDQLLSEFPHLAAVALVLWWYDRVRTRSTLLDASTTDLVVLGALVTLAFNMRREGIVLLAVIAGMQAVDLVRATSGPDRLARLGATVRAHHRALWTPYLAFAVTATLFQLLLPSHLLADNGNSAEFLDDRLGEYPETLAHQLGFGEHPLVGVIILGLAAAGAVVGVRARPTLDTPLLLLAVTSALAVSTHLREVERYWFQVTPWVLYFATVALTAATGFVVARGGVNGRRREAAQLLGVAPLVALMIAHLTVLPDKISAVDDFNDAGRVQSGPSNPVIAPIFTAVEDNTPPDAVIAYFRARTMTLLTDRRSIQTSSLDRILQRADYFAQRRDSTYWQPDLSRALAQVNGLEEVWSNDSWVLWRVPPP